VDKYVPGSRIWLITETGDEAIESEKLTDEERLANIMVSIRRTWPDAPDPNAYKFTSWGGDENAYGAYSALGVGSTDQTYAAFAKAHGSLFFAGEHTFHLYSGTAHAAYLSGANAAHRVLGDCEAMCQVKGLEASGTKNVLARGLLALPLVLFAVIGM